MWFGGEGQASNPSVLSVVSTIAISVTRFACARPQAVVETELMLADLQVLLHSLGGFRVRVFCDSAAIAFVTLSAAIVFVSVWRMHGDGAVRSRWSSSA